MNNTLLNINELIHELPIPVVQPNVFCVDCLIAIPIPLMAYKLDKVWVCKTCAHYLHCQDMDNCSVCCPNVSLEVSDMSDTTTLEELYAQRLEVLRDFTAPRAEMELAALNTEIAEMEE